MSAVVRITATGSLIPDSTSSVPPTRCLSWIPLPRNTANTAAASVDETIAPSRNDALHGKAQRVRDHGHDAHRPDHADGRQQTGRRERTPQRVDGRVQPAVEQDERERRRARRGTRSRNRRTRCVRALRTRRRSRSREKTRPTGSRSRCEAWLSSALAASSSATTAKNTAEACGSWGITRNDSVAA